MVVVEVRQGTLGVDGRGWGPTENTVRWGSQLDEEDEEDDEEDDEEEDDEEEEERRRRWGGGGEEEQATDIKSNNPHLAGGEKPSLEAQFPKLFLIQVPHGWTQILAIASHGLTFHAFLVKSIMETTTRHLKRIQWENVKYMYHTRPASNHKQENWHFEDSAL